MLSGEGVYADPWHDFAATSAAIEALLLEREDIALTVRTDVAPALEHLDESDMLVMNVGRSEQLDALAQPGGAIDRSLADFMDGGGAVWALHVSSTAMPDLARWHAAMGGRWDRGVSFHPPIGLAHAVVTTTHAITQGSDDFEVWDERYTDLVRAPDAVPLLSHDHDGAQHPLLWALERDGRRAVYDALGHTASSYRHPARAEILRRTRDWLLET